MQVMSKKRKEEIVIVDEELKPTVLATIEERKINFVGLILLFALFLGVIYFLPTISEKYQAYKKGQLNISSSMNNNNNNNDNDDNDENIKKYNYSNDLKITENSFTISNFNLEDNVLSFTITNNENSVLNLKTKNYYLNMYDDKNVLLKQIKILEDALNAQEMKNYSFNINVSSIAYLKLEEIKEEDYPNVSLASNNGSDASLTCRKDNDVIIYNFINNELNTISESITILNSNQNYNNELLNYEMLVTDYNDINGIQNKITKNENNFVYNIVIELNKAKIDNLNNVNYYNNKTQAKKVKFEVEARGYSCN